MPAQHRVWIAQILCPARHCILASAFDTATTSVPVGRASLVVQVEQLIQSGQLDPWCALCRSPHFSIETGPSKWRTMAEAEPHLRAVERDNLATRDYLLAARN